MTFYLMDTKSEDRMMIDSKPNSGCPIDQECEAGSWIEAKKKFGFELTPMQDEILRRMAS